MLPEPAPPAAMTIAQQCIQSIAAIATLLAAGCAAVESPAPLPEGRWEMSAASFADVERLPGTQRPALQIRDGRMAVSSGCNSGSSTVSAAAGRMLLSPLATTRRACAGPLGDFENRYFRLLGNRPAYRVEGEILVITAGDDSARFRRVAAPPAQP